MERIYLDDRGSTFLRNVGGAVDSWFEHPIEKNFLGTAARGGSVKNLLFNPLAPEIGRAHV
jgi:hypothetical protein